MSNQMIEMMTREQFCEVLGISLGTEAKLRAEGKLAHLRIGKKKIAYLPQHLAAALKIFEQPAASN